MTTLTQQYQDKRRQVTLVTLDKLMFFYFEVSFSTLNQLPTTKVVVQKSKCSAITL